MPNIKVHLHIGYSGCTREDIIQIPDEDYNDCTTAGKEMLCWQYCNDWANNYIDLGFSLIEDSD